MFEPNVVIWPFFETETVADRRRFTIKVLLLFLAFVFAGLLQWILAMTLLSNFCYLMAKNHSSALFLAFVAGLFIFMIFAISKSIRRTKCLNWIMTLFIVELLVVPIIALMVDDSLLHMLTGFLIASVIFLFCVILAATMPTDITTGGLYIYLMTLGFYLLSLYCIVLYSILNLTWMYYPFAILMACVVAFFLMYHVQCIMGGRAAATKLYDDLYAALLLFIELLALFILTLYF
ncbi:uncharacterized protein LOC110186823 [Drosophila serrata]|uniref:uncharacterized protein LOC110186823 n=1 Tax=Drosophila serrata TaxID=7274 RepID=UPI000A1D0C94|nr:uncharacterized protein LOC110186823 [Drosophila serrata]